MKKLICLLWYVPALMLSLPVNSTAQNGSLDASFQAEVNGTVRAIAVQTNGQILIAGSFSSLNGVPRRVARLNADGDLDRTFDPGSAADGHVNSVTFQNDGKAVIGGGFSTRIARLNTNGSLDTSFNVGSGADNQVWAVAMQNNGQVVFAGDFTTVNTSNRSRVARLNSDGSLDTSFEPSQIDNLVRCMTLQPDGRILIAGDFSRIGGTPRYGIARLRTDGSLDISFYPGAGVNCFPCGIHSIARDRSGSIVIGGSFTGFAGVSRNHVARLNADGSLDTSFNPGSGANDTVYSVTVQPDSKVLIGGVFTAVNGVPRRGIARLNADGSLDTTFAPGLGPTSGYVLSLAVQDDGKLLFGGDFLTVNGVRRVRITRLNADVLSPAATLSLKMYAGLTIAGQTGITYRVEYTSNLTNQTLWQTLTDLSLSNSPQFFLDTTSPFSTRRFYRAVTLP